MRGEARRDPGELPSSPLSLAGEEPSSQPGRGGGGQGKVGSGPGREHQGTPVGSGWDGGQR